MLSRKLIYNLARKNAVKYNISSPSSSVLFNNLIHTTSSTGAEKPHGLTDEEIDALEDEERWNKDT